MKKGGNCSLALSICIEGIQSSVQMLSEVLIHGRFLSVFTGNINLHLQERQYFVPILFLHNCTHYDANEIRIPSRQGQEIEDAI